MATAPAGRLPWVWQAGLLALLLGVMLSAVAWFGPRSETAGSGARHAQSLSTPAP